MNRRSFLALIGAGPAALVGGNTIASAQIAGDGYVVTLQNGEVITHMVRQMAILQMRQYYGRKMNFERRIATGPRAIGQCSYGPDGWRCPYDAIGNTGLCMAHQGALARYNDHNLITASLVSD